jgi:hypothetical protein
MHMMLRLDADASLFWAFVLLLFGFVSDFGFRASDLAL